MVGLDGGARWQVMGQQLPLESLGGGRVQGGADATAGLDEDGQPLLDPVHRPLPGPGAVGACEGAFDTTDR